MRRRPHGVARRHGPGLRPDQDHELVEAVMRFAGNGTGDTRWKVPGVLDWSTMVYNPHVDARRRPPRSMPRSRRLPVPGRRLQPDRGRETARRLARPLLPRVLLLELGGRRATLGIASFYLRAVCMNRNLWGVEQFEEITIRHSKYAASRFAQEAAPALDSSPIRAAAVSSTGIRAARERIVARTTRTAAVPAQARVLQDRDQPDPRDGARRRGPPARERVRFRAGDHGLRAHEPRQDARLELELKAKRLLEQVA